MATSTVEDYLKAILVEEQRDPESLVTTGRIAAACRVAPGTATSMVKTLADSALVTYEPYSGVRLTDAGRQLAAHVLRRHRLVELFLVEVLKMDWSEVHDEAERLEHAVSERLIDRIDEMLGRPTVDPHGDPIPTPEGHVARRGHVDLLTAPLATPLVVTRIVDQDPAFLRFIEQEGLIPGQPVVIEQRDDAADAVRLKHPTGRLTTIGLRAASKVQVESI